MPARQQSFSIVIPIYNEALNIECLLKEIQQAVPQGQDYEIVVVDDGSCDNTKSVLQALKAKFPQLRAMFHKDNSGQSAAILTGVMQARYEWIITLDGDGQNDPVHIAAMIAAACARAENGKPVLVNGHRTKRKDTWLKKISSRFANGVRKTFLKDSCPDSGCGLKCFKREDFLRLPHFNHMHRFLPALYRLIAGEVVNFPVNHRPRNKGVSKYGIRNRLFVGIIDLFGVFWLLRRPCRPQSFESD